jgi:hypothetical protein
VCRAQSKRKPCPRRTRLGAHRLLVSTQSTAYGHCRPPVFKDNLGESLPGLWRGGCRCRHRSDLLSAAFHDGPKIATQPMVSDGTVSQLHGGGLALRFEMQLQCSLLSPDRRLGRRRSCDHELLLVRTRIEPKAMGRAHGFRGTMHAVRKLRRLRWKIRHFLGLVMTQISQARLTTRADTPD